jgi:hypothetical protein
VDHDSTDHRKIYYNDSACSLPRQRGPCKSLSKAKTGEPSPVEHPRSGCENALELTVVLTYKGKTGVSHPADLLDEAIGRERVAARLRP